jgi:uncharacterized protein (DUF2126 family)
MLDGRHGGTGGGNHMVLGGATVHDSPFLRRPDLLRSLLSYWHNHPSISFLFSGLFIGPTSQAPRIDEARNDAVFEMEIAFREMERAARTHTAGRLPPWLVDRLLRNLLCDVTGNTHRTEMCIDKLFSPDGPAGRLGLVEMRAFEMPPHARMSLAQQLLLRALVARFWKTPYAPRASSRWGTELHDRFMLAPFRVARLQDVLEECRHGFGYALKSEHFAPHFEFRFPKYGDIAGASRSSCARAGALARPRRRGGLRRHRPLRRLVGRAPASQGDRRRPGPVRVTCNGHALPLRAHGRVGEYVAGVRYRAWQPPVCLHPTIGVHSPLTFDLVDTWMDRSLGGCQYHVMHPGGRSFETFPVNAFEAEGRRLAPVLPHEVGVEGVRHDLEDCDAFFIGLDLAHETLVGGALGHDLLPRDSPPPAFGVRASWTKRGCRP